MTGAPEPVPGDVAGVERGTAPAAYLQLAQRPPRPYAPDEWAAIARAALTTQPPTEVVQ